MWIRQTAVAFWKMTFLTLDESAFLLSFDMKAYVHD